MIKISHGGVCIEQTTTIHKCHEDTKCTSLYQTDNQKSPNQSSPFNHKINWHFNSSDEIAGSKLTIKTVFMNGDFNHHKYTTN